jgi:hypothetical protein
LFEPGSQKPGENQVLAWAAILQHSKDPQRKFFRILAAKYCSCHPSHIRPDLPDWHDCLLGGELEECGEDSGYQAPHYLSVLR